MFCTLLTNSRASPSAISFTSSSLSIATVTVPSLSTTQPFISELTTIISSFVIVNSESSMERGISSPASSFDISFLLKALIAAATCLTCLPKRGPIDLKLALADFCTISESSSRITSSFIFTSSSITSFIKASASRIPASTATIIFLSGCLTFRFSFARIALVK